MRILALDISKRSTGFALWGTEDRKVMSGAWPLGSEYTDIGTACCRLHERMTELHIVSQIDAVFWERPRHLDGFNDASGMEEHDLLVSLAGHARSWATAMGCRYRRDVHMQTWRAHAYRKIGRPKGRDALKQAAFDVSRGFGFRPRTDDEAEAILILDWGCDFVGITPYWRPPASAAAE